MSKKLVWKCITGVWLSSTLMTVLERLATHFDTSAIHFHYIVFHLGIMASFMLLVTFLFIHTLYMAISFVKRHTKIQMNKTKKEQSLITAKKQLRLAWIFLALFVLFLTTVLPIKITTTLILKSDISSNKDIINIGFTIFSTSSLVSPILIMVWKDDFKLCKKFFNNRNSDELIPVNNLN